jgi:(2Fe-2S) ferredoxin
MNRGTKLLEDLKERSEPLGKNISVKPISCLGQCDRAPTICLNDIIYPNMTPDDAETLISTAMAGFELAVEATSTRRLATDLLDSLRIA